MTELPSDRALVELVYNELHRLASSFLRRNRPGHTLQTSALLNEAYLRLAGGNSMRFEDRQHYIRVAACAMRQVLVDHARRRNSQKRDSGPLVDLDRHGLNNPGWIDRGKMEEYLTIDASLRKLAEIDARQAEIVELRFFGGLSVEETAQALAISEKTVKRDWSIARAWLRGELEQAASM
jgi:RNA polymerase sigma-70 factor, ECF subfamily